MTKAELWDKLKEEMEIKAEGHYNREKGYERDDASKGLYEKMCQMEILGNVKK